MIRLHRDYSEIDYIHAELDMKLKHTGDVRWTARYIIPDLW